jgi:O-antigen ligase
MAWLIEQICVCSFQLNFEQVPLGFLNKNMVFRVYKSLTHAEWFKTAVLSFVIISVGIFLGHLVLSRPLPQVLAFTLGIVLVAFSIYKIEFPFYISVLVLAGFITVAPIHGNILAFLVDRDYPGIPTIFDMIIGLLCICFFIRVALRVQVASFSPFNIYIVFFFFLLAVSIIVGLRNGVDSLFLKQDFKKFLLPVLYFICCVNLADSPRRIQVLLISILSIAFVKSCIGVIFYLQGLGFVYEYDKIVVFLETADHLIFVTIITVVFSFIIYKRVTGNRILLLLFLIFPMFFSVLFSYRRHSWVGLLLSLLILFFLSPTSRKFRMVAMGGCMSLILLSLMSFASLSESIPSTNFLTNRFLSVFDSKQGSNVMHVAEWRVALEDSLENPLFGLGLGSTHRHLVGHEDIPNDIVHNAFLMLWMKMGLLSVVLFLWCLIRYFRFSTNVAKKGRESTLKALQVGLFSTFGFWLVSLNVGPSWFYLRETCLIGLVIAVVINLSRFIEAPDNLQQEAV